MSFDLLECSKIDTCVGSDFCWTGECPLKNVYKNVSEKAPESSKNIYRSLLKAIASGKNIFLTAGAGAGKTFFLNQLSKELPDKITLTATTGVAALNICGTTIHSALGLGLGKKPVKEMLSKLNSYKLDFLNRIKILAIDEVSMLSGELMNKCNEFLKLARMNNQPFGGIQVILIGDFCQLPPVDDTEFKAPVKDFCFYSSTWKELNPVKFELTHNFRQEDDTTYAEILRKLRQGELTEKGYNLIKSREIEPPAGVPRLYATNQEVRQYNTEQLHNLNKPVRTFVASYSTPNNNIKKNVNFYQNLVEKMKKSSIIEDELSFCVNARVMLLRNIDIEAGLVNGSLGLIECFADDGSILVHFDNGEERYIKKEITQMFDAEGKILLEQTQYPLKLAYGCTIHKAQGCSLDKIFIDFDKFFEINQGYVALSRVRKSSGLYVRNFSTRKLNFSRDILDFYAGLDTRVDYGKNWTTSTETTINQTKGVVR